MKNWDSLSWWSSKDADTVKTRLDKGDHRPDRELVFAAMDECPLDKVKVVFCGQDPYPGEYERGKPYATGLSFSIPSDAPLLTPTLSCLFSEYISDLHYPTPTTGDLTPWAKQGVMLWNVYLSCHNGVSLSHRWTEWESLTKEVFEVVSKQGAVFILLGAIPRQFKQYVSMEDSYIVEAAYPMADVYASSAGVNKKRTLFKGSRIFTKTNDLLCSLKMDQIDWRLP
jgi:uracil-DNA glycosylase